MMTKKISINTIFWYICKNADYYGKKYINFFR
jgi:hypothetical protein